MVVLLLLGCSTRLDGNDDGFVTLAEFIALLPPKFKRELRHLGPAVLEASSAIVARASVHASVHAANFVSGSLRAVDSPPVESAASRLATG